MYTKTANLMQASSVSGGFTEVQNENLSLSESRKIYICIVLNLKIVQVFKVCKSLHYHTIQINCQLDATISPVYYPDVYLQLSLFWASSRPSSGAQ
jgi:hypothetical protein